MVNVRANLNHWVILLSSMKTPGTYQARLREKALRYLTGVALIARAQPLRVSVGVSLALTAQKFAIAKSSERAFASNFLCKQGIDFPFSWS